MKKIPFNYLLVAIATILIGLSSCKEDDPDVGCDDNITNGNEITLFCDIIENTTWTSDNVYILGKRIYVTDGATLTIEPGTIIKGEAGSEASSKALIIARGGKINAQGTATLPIIFTSVSDNISPDDIANGNFASPNLTETQSGLWGGLVILGRAEISASEAEVQIEGIPSSETNGLYGGTNNNDNSGTLRYVSIRHGGTDIGAGNEINGLTLGGVGSATTIEHIEIVANQDDGIEWFGGTVDVSNVIVWNAGDDALDTDQGWSGTCSNFIIVNPAGSCFELDGPEGTALSTGNHKFNMGTIYAGSNGGVLVDCDDNTNVDMTNLYFYGIASGDTATESIADVIAAGGDFSSWEYTMNAGYNPAEVFYEFPASELTSVTENNNTVGVQSSTGFEWTWASQSNALNNIGL